MSQSMDGDHKLEGTELLVTNDDLALEMVAGIDRYLTRELETSSSTRAEHWRRDFSSRDSYIASVDQNRTRLARIIGAVDTRDAPRLEIVTAPPGNGPLARNDSFAVHAVRWTVIRGVQGEGLLLEPAGTVWACVVAIPDCDVNPEAVAGLTAEIPARAQFARRLAESGCRVIIPTLVDRRDTFSGRPDIRMTNQPHREWIYRPAFEAGRHIIGYEVAKVLSAVDWFDAQCDLPIGVIGYGEGGLLGFYSAAIDTRIDAACVSGYFQPRESLWAEPIYRNVWALLDEFGDAEIASLVAPRALIIEASSFDKAQARDEDVASTPGEIRTPPFEAVQREFARAEALIDGLTPPPALQLVAPESGKPGSEEALGTFTRALGVSLAPDSGTAPFVQGTLPDLVARTQRTVKQLIEDTQYLMREATYTRGRFWADADNASLDSWQRSCETKRAYLWDEVIGRLDVPSVPANPRSRLVYDTPAYRGYEVVLDVCEDVFAYGILLVPKDIADGERRPVVVCQHGLESRAQDVVEQTQHEHYYKHFGAQLAEQGFIVYAPQNPYVGGDAFRVLQRKANPLKLSLFSFIVAQHQRTLEWLRTLEYVDGDRIAFYGLSYGGKTAMRVPALLPEYCVSICSGDFNEWIWKTMSTRVPFAYPFTGEYEMFEFNLANTFNYAEMSWLILPRPFMVERGHHDGVGIDEWVAYEYARTQRQYDHFGIGDLTEIEYFDGPHTIHGVGTFEFLKRHLGFWQDE